MTDSLNAREWSPYVMSMALGSASTLNLLSYRKRIEPGSQQQDSSKLQHH